jgi:glycosyltransferase involved in cell wall biosynthesis
MKPSPRVSVLLPVRDAALTLGECLRSLRTQTLADHEVVAVDDGSTDDSLALLRAAAGQDPRVRVFSTEPRGIVSALNRALLAARAPFVARMDADDVAHEERLGRQWERFFREPGLDVLGTRVSANGLGSNRGMLDYVAWSNALLTHDDIVRDLYVESPLVHPTVMMRRSRLAALSGFRSFDGPEDYDLWLRARRAGWRFGKLPEELLFWRDSPGRLTRREGRYAPDRFLARKIQDLEERDLLAGGVVVWGAGPIGKAWSRGLQARGHAVAAFVEVDARKVGQRIHGAPVIAVDGVAATVGSRLHLAAVGQRAARERIRAFGARHGLRDGHDLLAVA